MTLRSLEVDTGDGTVTVRVRGGDGPALLLAHGAGTNQDHPMMATLAEGLASHGLVVITFNYPYTEAGRRAPDRAPKLLTCHRAVGAWARSEHGAELVFGGRSMGGRMASLLAAEGEPMRGLVLFAYPLHPAGRPDRLRTDHLGDIQVPMLFVQGSRDSLARPELFDQHVRRLEGAEVFDLDGADHAWRLPGHDPKAVTNRVAGAAAVWIHRLARMG